MQTPEAGSHSPLSEQSKWLVHPPAAAAPSASEGQQAMSVASTIPAAGPGYSMITVHGALRRAAAAEEGPGSGRACPRAGGDEDHLRAGGQLAAQSRELATLVPARVLATTRTSKIATRRRWQRPRRARAAAAVTLVFTRAYNIYT